MKRTLVLLAAVLVSACAGNTVTVPPAHAADQPNLIVMGEDADQDTVPRSSRVFRRVLDNLIEELHVAGYNVYDETAATLDNFVQGRVRRTDVEIIDIARSIRRPPIDVATLFSIYASAEQLSYTTKVKTRISGRLLNVNTGQRLGNFEVELPEPFTAPQDCPRECILEVVGANAAMLARDLGAALTIKLQALTEGNAPPPTAATGAATGGLATAYAIIFDGFTTGEITSIEEYLVAFQGYQHHRPVGASLRRSEYWYETSADSARLNRNLRLMLDRLGLAANIVHSSGSNTFNVKKIATR